MYFAKTLKKTALPLTSFVFLLSFVLQLPAQKADNFIEATPSQQYNKKLTMDRGDFVMTSTHFRFTPQGLSYYSGGEKFQRAVLMRAANGDRWAANFQMKWVAGDTLGAGLYFAYESMGAHYYAGVSGQQAYIMRNGEKVYEVRYQTPKNKWLSFRIRRKENKFQVWINNVKRLEYVEDRPVQDGNTQRNPLPYGGYALGTDNEISSNTKVLFRNLRIAGNQAQKPLKHAYVEQTKLKEGRKNVIIWVYKPNKLASKRAKTLAKSIKIMEQISGLKYPTAISAEATAIDYKAPYTFLHHGQVFFPDRNTLLAHEKTQDFLAAFGYQWDYFQELWLVGGFPLFLAGATIQELRGKPFIFKNVPAFKKALKKMNSKTFKDIAVDGVYVGPEDVKQQIIQGREFYVQKGALFLYMLYRDLGPKQFAKAMAKAVQNLKGKQFQRSRRIDSENFLVAVTEVAKTHYKAYFNGWIFRGKYSHWSPSFFVDKDKDGLLLMEEKIAGTDDSKLDTDKDGYSDTWEYLNGFDPKDSKKPATARIAVDGYVLDWANFNHVASTLDPINDISTSYNRHDVRKVMMRGDQKYIYIGVQYHNDIRLNVGSDNQRFKFRFDGKEFHTGQIDYDDGEFLAQRLKGKDLWYDYFALDKGFLIEFGLDMEIKIPTGFFDQASRIELQYSGPGEVKGRKVDYQADPVTPIEVFRVKQKDGRVVYLPLQAYQQHIWGGFGVEKIKTSAHSDNHPARMAMDRRSQSYWEGKHPGDWIMLKLDKMAQARKLLVELDPNIQNKIWVEVSKDGDNWRTVVKDSKLQPTTAKRVIQLQETEQFREKFRYVRIHMLNSNAREDNGRIYEVNFAD
jgi:hypothetical protein